VFCCFIPDFRRFIAMGGYRIGDAGKTQIKVVLFAVFFIGPTGVFVKIFVTAAVLILISVLHSSLANARDWKEDQAMADQYYEQGKYGKAFGLYYRNAKIGVSQAQDMVSQMYEKGQGKKVNLEDAYAWSVLAAERGSNTIEERRDSLLERVQDKQAAEKKAEKLLARYGRAALQRKADSKARLKANTKSGGCTGSKLDCR